MSEDNDFWDTDSRQRGQTSLAFIAFMGWLICLPFDLCASLRRGTGRDDGDHGADWSGEGSFETHNAANITGVQHNHG